MCVLGSIIRTGCLAPYVHSVQGSWENMALRGLRCYCYLPPPRVAFEGRKYKSGCGPRGMWQWFLLCRPLTSLVHPHMLSHTTPSAPNTHSPEPESEAGTVPVPALRTFASRFVWPANGKQMDAAERTDKEEEEKEAEGQERKRRSIFKRLRRKITQGLTV